MLMASCRRPGASPGTSGGDTLSPARAHDLALEVLVELVHAAEQRPRTAIADRLAVELNDRQHLFGGGRDPDLIRGAHGGFANVAELERQAVRAGELHHHVVRDAGKDELILRRRLDHLAAHDEHVGRGRLGQLAVAQKERLDCIGLGRKLAQQHVTDERDRLDVAAQPAIVARSDHARAALHLHARRRHQRIRHHEDGWLRVLRKGVIALGNAARHLEVDALVLEWLALDQAGDRAAPLLARVRVADADSAQAALKATEVLFQPEGHLGIDRDHLVHPVAEDESAVEHRHLGLGERHETAVQENYLIHSLSVSNARPKMSARATVSSATTGYSAYGFPSSVTRSVPTRLSALTGATSGCCDTSSA